ncbi:MAG TPA: hypothetical protein PKO16_07725 [Bacteroidia bacterium]|nr:hypothetical protein [Bacteroidia bacterium]
MKQFIILFILLFLCNIQIFSQKSTAKEQFIESDSVILVSHEDTGGENWSPSDGEFPKLLTVEGNLNTKLIRERHRLQNQQIVSLASLITAKSNNTSLVEEKGCYKPHHSILVYKNGLIQFIELCFECQNFKTSKEFSSIVYFDNYQWGELKKFFNSNGLTYRLM